MELLKLILEFIEKAGVFMFFSLGESSPDSKIGYGFLYIILIVSSLTVLYYVFELIKYFIERIFALLSKSSELFFGIFKKEKVIPPKDIDYKKIESIITDGINNAMIQMKKK